jgi:hypothetical protein
MQATVSLRGIGLLLVFSELWIAACGKDASAGSNDGAATAPASPAVVAASPSEANATGVWQVVKLEDDKGKSLKGGIFDDMLSEKTDVRPDHTYGMTNTAIGHASGTWKLSGDKLLLTRTASSGVTITLTVEPPHLVNRISTDLTITYDKAGPSPSDTSPKFHVKASEFLDEVKKNFSAAKSKYHEARVEVSGVVVSMDNMATGPTVTVAGPAAAGEDASHL